MRLPGSHRLHRYYESWLKRRLPAEQKQSLNRKNIFIFPSVVGFSFVLTIFLLWLLGTNYQNNLIIVLSFLLLSLIHTCIFYSYANFSGLSIEAKSVSPCFVGEAIKVECLLRNERKTRSHYQISLGWDEETLVTIDVDAKQTEEVTLWLPATKRGVYGLERVMIRSVYPLGLIRTWAKLDLDLQAIVYPKPVEVTLPEASIVADESSPDYIALESARSDEINDDVSHLRKYQQGDPLKHVAWKAYAKGQGLATKVYENMAKAQQQMWFTWDDFSGLKNEERLSCLCFCILEAEKQEQAYGLVLPGFQLPLGSGTQHQSAALYALANFSGGVSHE